jgi:predicted porin
VKNEGSSKRWSLGRDGINSSQLGFRGIEDLGDGFKAGFVVLSSVGADSGDLGSGQSAFMAAAGEPGQAGQSSNNGRYLGGRAGFASGPFDVAFAMGQRRDVT